MTANHTLTPPHHHHQQLTLHPLPPKTTLNILLRKVHLHILLPLSDRVHSPNQPLRPVKRALVELLRLSTHEIDEVPRSMGAFAFHVAKVLFDAAAQEVDVLAHFFVGVVLFQEVAEVLAGESGAGRDGGRVAAVGG